MKKFSALLPLAVLLLTENADARCPAGYASATVAENGVPVTRCVSDAELSALEDGNSPTKLCQKDCNKKKKDKIERKACYKECEGKDKDKDKDKPPSGGGGSDSFEKTNTQMSSVVTNGVRIYQTADQAQSAGATGVFELNVPAGGTVSAVGSIVITRCNECDVKKCDKGGENVYYSSCFHKCGQGANKQCYGEKDFQPLMQARAVIGNCACDWSALQTCTKEMHHCTLVAPLCTCEREEIGSGKAYLQVAVNSGGAQVSSHYVMSIKDSKAHGFFSVFSGRAVNPVTARLGSPLSPIHANYDDNKKFTPEWNNVLSVQVGGGNKGKPLAVQGSFKLTLDPWDPFHKGVQDTCSPLVLARVLFNKQKHDYRIRQPDDDTEDSKEVFSTKVSQNCEHPDWSSNQKRVCEYNFADTGILDTDDAGYVSVALNLHKSCIMEPNQEEHPEVEEEAKKGKWDKNYKAKGDYYKVLNADIAAAFIQ